MEPVVITYPTSLPREDIDELEKIFSEEGVSVRANAHQPPRAINAIELLLATAAILYFGKSYFDGFFSEAGKRHYDVVRKAASKCWSLFFGDNPKYKYRLSDSEGNERPNQYSRTFSVVSETSDGSKVKLLIEEATSEAVIGDIIETFLRQMAQHHAGIRGTVDDLMDEGPPMGASYYLVRVDPNNHSLVPVYVGPEWLRRKS